MRERVEQVINRLRPAIQKDGGDIELVDVSDGVVKLKLLGTCAGCESTSAAIQKGIERAILAEVPEVQSVEFTGSDT